MTKKAKAPKLKVHRNFKLEPELNDLLKREAAKSSRTETAVLELALKEWFSIKR